MNIVLLQEINEAHEYVLKKSWQARRGGKYTHKLVEEALLEINQMYPQQLDVMEKHQLVNHLKLRLKSKKVGNPLIAIFINILISIVAKLIVDWWFKRQGYENG